MPAFREEVSIERAVLTKVGSGDRVSLTVDFNPTSLQLQLSNTFKQEGGKTTQHVSGSSAKLTVDLVFDTTDTLADVRSKTGELVKLMTPARSGKHDAPTVLFEWGAFSFRGVIESLKETIDFFSAGGVPLRSSVNLTLAHQDLVFGDEERDKARRKALAGKVTGEEEPVELPLASEAAGPGVSGPLREADTAEAGDTGRDVAAANGLESLRFPEGPIVVDPAISLGPPVAFAAGSAGASAGASFGAGAAAGLGGGLGASAIAGFGAGASAGAGAFAGVGAGAVAGGSAGAFAGAGAGTFGSAGAFAGGGGGAFAGAGAGAFAGAGAGAFAGAGAGAFAGASAGAFAGAGAGAFAGAGAGAFAGAGTFAGAGAGAITGTGGVLVSPGEAPIFGGRASAGVPASLGAFAGLRAPLPRPRPVIDTSLLLPPRPSAYLLTGAGASFDLTGRAHLSASAGGSASLNGRPVLSERVSFEEEW